MRPRRGAGSRATRTPGVAGVWRRAHRLEHQLLPDALFAGVRRNVLLLRFRGPCAHRGRERVRVAAGRHAAARQVRRLRASASRLGYHTPPQQGYRTLPCALARASARRLCNKPTAHYVPRRRAGCLDTSEAGGRDGGLPACARCAGSPRVARHARGPRQGAGARACGPASGCPPRRWRRFNLRVVRPSRALARVGCRGRPPFAGARALQGAAGRPCPAATGRAQRWG